MSSCKSRVYEPIVFLRRAGQPETNFNNRPHSFKVLTPSRTCVAYARVPEAVVPGPSKHLT